MTLFRLVGKGRGVKEAKMEAAKKALDFLARFDLGNQCMISNWAHLILLGTFLRHPVVKSW